MTPAIRKTFRYFSFLCAFSFFFGFLILQVPQLYADTTTDYQQTVPAVLDKITSAVKDSDQKESVAQWTVETSRQLPDFLSDMISLSISFQDQPLFETDFSKMNDFVAKWERIVNSCSGCDDVVPLVKPMIDRFMGDLPTLRSPQAGDVPLQNLAEFYQKMERRNPSGIGSLFQIEPLPFENRQLAIRELSQERTLNGVKKTAVVQREVVQTVNSTVNFQERIENDRPVRVFLRQDFPTMLEEALTHYRSDNGDPKVVESLKQVVLLVEDKLRQAKENNTLDEFAYNFLFNQEAIKNDMLAVRHPLRRNPYNKVYKTTEFYPPSRPTSIDKSRI